MGNFVLESLEVQAAESADWLTGGLNSVTGGAIPSTRFADRLADTPDGQEFARKEETVQTVADVPSKIVDAVSDTMTAARQAATDVVGWAKWVVPLGIVAVLVMGAGYVLAQGRAAVGR